MKLVELCRFTHRYDFHAWLDGVHGIAQTSRLKKKKNMLIIYFFKFLATRKKFLHFLLQFWAQITCYYY